MAQTLTLPMILPVGTMLYGYCNGYFGRESYSNKRVEAVGADWVVARNEAGYPECAVFESEFSPALIESWKEER